MQTSGSTECISWNTSEGYFSGRNSFLSLRNAKEKEIKRRCSETQFTRKTRDSISPAEQLLERGWRVIPAV
jgi:hypothetical protein